ncbi:MAG: response regulator [Gammaproteobacteria bacterium]|nr:response regulator [Gammaproteobacteria bacterium]
MIAGNKTIKRKNTDKLKHRFIRGSTLQVLVWPFICVMLVILVWYITLSKIDTDRRTLEKNALKDVSTFSHAYADYVSQSIETLNQITLHIRSNWEPLHNGQVLEELARNGVFRHAQITQVSIIDQNGIPVKNLFSSNSSTLSVVDKKYFRFHKNDASDVLLVGKPTESHFPGKNILTFTRRLNTTNGSFDGLVIISVEPSYLTSFYAGSNPGTTGLLAVVGADGALRAARIGEKLTATLPEIIPLFNSREGADLLKDKQWFGDKLSRYVAWKTLDHSPLIIMAGISEQEYLKPHQQTWTTYRQVAIAGSFLLFLFALVATRLSVRLSRKRHQAEEIRKTYRIATEGGNEGFYMFDVIRDTNDIIVDFKLVDCNERGADFYGIKKDQLLGQTLSSLYTSSNFDELMDIFRTAMESGFYEDEKQISKGSPLKMEWGKIRLVRSGSGLAVTVQNISERKKADEALRESEKKLRLIHSQVPGIVYQFKVDTHGKKILPYVSPAIESYVGLTAETVMNDAEKWFELTHPDDLPSLEKSILESMVNLSIWEWEGRFIRDSGKIIWLRGRSTPERLDDGSTLWNGLFVDVTERRSQDEQFRRTQKMDALGKLTGGIAHDYNNILGIILGYAEQINEHINDKDKVEKYSDTIKCSAERGSKLAKKLLTFSRYKLPDVAVMSINCLLQEQQHMLEKMLTVNHKFLLDLEENLWPVELDSGDMEDAILNMSINALHAIMPGGQITISTNNKQLNTIDAQLLGLSAGDYVLLRITDTGIGMDTITKEKIFDPFFTTKGEEGTGLGLSQVYGFVERSHGVIKVYSELGHGSRFELYFPRSNKSIPKKITSPINIAMNLKGNETLLVVDDEEDMADLEHAILTSQGYHVITANNGEQALAILEKAALKKEKIDLIISDVVMPNMDGYQLAEQVRQRFPHIKLQMVSGFSDERQNGMADNDLHLNMLHKPYTSNVLLTRVRQLLDENSSASLSNRTILVMDDDEDIRTLFKLNLKKLGCNVIAAINVEEALDCYQNAFTTDKPIDLTILDLSIPGGIGGKEAAEAIRNIHPHAKIIVASGDSEGPEMMEPLDYGFDGALEKKFDLKNIDQILKKVLITENH